MYLSISSTRPGVGKLSHRPDPVLGLFFCSVLDLKKMIFTFLKNCLKTKANE